MVIVGHSEGLPLKGSLTNTNHLYKKWILKNSNFSPFMLKLSNSYNFPREKGGARFQFLKADRLTLRKVRDSHASSLAQYSLGPKLAKVVN